MESVLILRENSVVDIIFGILKKDISDRDLFLSEIRSLRSSGL